MRPLTKIVAIIFAFNFSSCNKNDKSGGDNGETRKDNPGSAKQEEIANRILDSMQEFASAVSGITDTKSAKAAAAKINEIGDRFSSYAEELEPLDPPTREVREALHRKMKEKEAEIGKVMKGDFLNTIQRLTPDAQRVIQKAFQDFYQKKQSVGEELDRHFKIEG